MPYKKRPQRKSNDIDVRNLTPTGNAVFKTAFNARDMGIDTILWYAAVRSGKTVSILATMVLYAHWLNSIGKGNGLFVLGGSTQDNITNNMLPALNSICDALGLSYDDSRGSNVKAYVGGFAEFIAFGGQQKDSFKPVQGLTVTAAFIDEATLLDRSFIETVYQRLSFDESLMFMAMNAHNPHHWIKKTYIDDRPDNVRVFSSLFDENQHLSNVRKKDLLNMNKMGLLYGRNIKNEWTPASGIIYPVTNEQIVTLEEPLPLCQYVGVDVGNVTAAVGINKGVGRSYVVDEYYYSRIEEYGEIKTQSEHAEAIVAKFGKQATYLIDPSNPTMKKEFRKLGVAALAAKNPVMEGIGLVSQRLFNGQLLINNKCERLLEEMASYSWNEEETDKPVKIGDHACDALRYVIMTAMHPFNTI